MTVTIHQGDALAVLRTLPSAAVQCVVTSPPYFQLRDYGTPGQIGLERTPAAFIAALLDVFDEVGRVLRPDGLCFVNLGDSYSGSGKGPTDQEHRQGFRGGSNGGFHDRWDGQPGRRKQEQGRSRDGNPSYPGIPAKNLLLIPERFAIGMQERGWTVRSRIAWCKTSAMPESVRDRPTSAWEHIWMFSKSRTYYYDAEAVRSPLKAPDVKVPQGFGGHKRNGGTTYSGNPYDASQLGGANLRNYWAIPDTIRHGEPQENSQDVHGLQDAPAPRRLLLPEGWVNGESLSAVRGPAGGTGAQGERGPVRGVHAELSAEPGGAAGDTALRGLSERSSSAGAAESEAPLPEAQHPDDADRRGMAGDPGAVREPVRVLWSDGSVTDYRPRHPDQQGREPHEGQRGAGVSPVQQPEEGQAPLTPFWLLGPEPSSLEHYAGFPTALPKRCILAGSRKGDTVLDPFLGSGTTALVADRLGRDAIGIEINPTYARMARERIESDEVLFSEPVTIVAPNQIAMFEEAIS